MHQLLADHTDVQSFLSELGSVGVAQAVGVNSFVDAGAAANPIDIIMDKCPNH